MAKGKLKELLALLSDERQAIRTGRLTELEKFATHKAALAEHVASLKLSADEAAELKAAAERNARLLQAAIRGVKDAQARLKALHSARTELNLYSADGARTQIATPASQLERKA